MKNKIRFIFALLLVVGGCIYFFWPNILEWDKQRKVDQIIERFEESYEIQSEERDVQFEAETQPTNQKSDDQEDKENSPEQTKLDIASDETSTDEGMTVQETEKSQEKRVFTELYYEMEAYNEDLFFNGQEITDSWSYEQNPINIASLNSEEPVIGYVDIPDMDVRLPLFLGASSENLQKGAAVLAETSMPIGGENTNCVIAGHRGWNGMAYFQRIENLKKGSKVFIRNPWETLVYEVDSVKVIDPNDINSILIQPGEDMVTLFTCHPYVIGGGPYRYLAFCKRAGTEERSSSEKVNNPKADPIPDEEQETIVTEQKLLPIEDATQEQPSQQRTVKTAMLRESDDSFLKLETELRIWFPVFTIILAVLIFIIRIILYFTKK